MNILPPNNDFDKVLIPAECLKALQLMEEAATLSISYDYFDANRAYKKWHEAMSLPFPTEFTMTAHIVYKAINDLLIYWSSEHALHRIFSDFHQVLIPCSSLIRHELEDIIPNQIIRDVQNIPDFIIGLSGDTYLVEIKASPFNESALSQLQRYIKTHKIPNAYAVAPSLEIELPKNIKFVHISYQSILDRIKNLENMLKPGHG